MHNIDLILLLAGGFGAALVFGYITHRLHLSPIVGYLLAGVLIGPHSPGFHADVGMAEQLAEVGVILLMFGVGLHFDLKDLLAVRRVAVPGAVMQSAFATVLGALAAVWLGWSWTSGLVFGLCLSVASTVVLIRVLSDNNALHTQTGHIAVGWLIVEDIFTVVVLVLLPAMFAAPAVGAAVEGGSVWWALAATLAKVAILGLLVFTAGARVIPWLLTRVARTRSRELFTLAVLAVALGIAVGSTLGFGVSMALGAFLAGMIVGRSDYSSRAAAEALPLRDAFAVLFFVSIGMLFDPRAIWADPLLAAGAFAIVVVGKPFIAAVVTRALGYPLAVTLPVATALSQIGEFSFILARAGQELGVLPEEAGNVVIAVAIGSIVLNPLLYRTLPAILRWTAARPWLWRLLNGAQTRTPDDEGAVPPLTGESHRAVVVGFGPSGRTLSRLLKENGVTPTIVELNLENAREARQMGFRTIYGDATNQSILEEAGVAVSDTIVLTSAGMEHSEDTIREARELNHDIHVMARAAYIRHVPSLRDAGADRVFSGEAEVALAMTEAMLDRLGATAEQVDRERARVREEIGEVRPAGARPG